MDVVYSSAAVQCSAVPSGANDIVNRFVETLLDMLSNNVKPYVVAFFFICYTAVVHKVACQAILMACVQYSALRECSWRPGRKEPH